MTEEENLFNEWTLVCGQLLNLKSFVQNNFDSMIKDGYVTKDQIKQSSIEFKAALRSSLNNISYVATKIDDLINKKAI